VRRGRDSADAGWRDLSNRASGVVARMRAAWHPETPDDDVLAERVRSVLGRRVSHPHGVAVEAHDGWVTLSGPILEREVAGLVRAVQSVRGVRHVKNQLAPHADGHDVPALQGGRRTRPRSELAQDHWAPGPRLAVFGAGTALALYGAGRRGVPGTLLMLVGVGLAARAATNRDLARLLGLSSDPYSVEVEKGIHIAASREQVFEVWSRCEKFPHFMSLVEEVRPLDRDRWHWVVKGPAGKRIEWTSTVTEHEPPSRIAWSTEPDAPVQHAGQVRFDPTARGTRVTVRMSYRPPAGVIGHTLATLFGRDAKQELDADLMRLKAYVETGRAPHDAAEARQAKRNSHQAEATV
jgi:uncharacterized membrane protein